MSGKDFKSMKVSEATLDQFVQFVKNKDKGLCDKAADAKLDIVPILKHIKEDVVADLSILSGVVKGVSAVRAALEMALAKEVPCYYLGMKDRPGNKMPATAVFLKLADGAGKGAKATLFEATTFDPKFEMPDGSKKELTTMCKVTLKLKENTKFDSFEVVQLVKYEEVAVENMGKLLAGVINDPRKFTEDDKYMPIVLLANIRGVYPVSILAKNEDDDWKQVGDHPLMVLNQLEEDPVKTPTFRLWFEPIYGITVRASFDPRKYTQPIIDVADLKDSIKVAVRDIKEPKNQALAVGELLAERDVILVGSVQKVSSTKSGATYMEISAFSMIDAPQRIDWFESGISESPSAPAAPPADVEPVAKKDGKESKKKGKGAAASNAVPPVSGASSANAAPQAEKPVTKFEEVKTSILEYCTKLNMKPSQLTVEIVKDQVCPSAKEGTIEAALDEINS